MSNNLFFTALLSVAGAASLSAQAPAQIATTTMEQSELTAIVDNLEQLGLFTLAGIIILAGIFFICCVIKACSFLNHSKNKIRHTFIHVMVLAVGVCSLGSSCTSTQQALAAEISTAREAETFSCSMQLHEDLWESELQRNRYANYGPNYRNVPVFCRYCGQRIWNVHR